MSMRFLYQARFEPGEDGAIYVSFPDVPEAVTFGQDEAEATREAADALATALLFTAGDGKALPLPATPPSADLVPIAVPIDAAMKIMVIDAFNASGMSKTDLARQLGKAETEARRILDPSTSTKVATLQAALAVLGRRAVVEVGEAA